MNKRFSTAINTVIMETKNRVELIGHVGKDPEIVSLENGKKLGKFSLATNELFQNSHGEWVNETTWHRIVAWGKLAELIGALVTKGQKMEVIGKIKNYTFEAPDGNKRYYTDIRCEEFKLMGGSEKKKHSAQAQMT